MLSERIRFSLQTITKSSIVSVRRSAFDVRRSAFAFGVRRSAFGVRHSAIRRSAFGVQAFGSTFGARRSAFNIRFLATFFVFSRCTFGVRRAYGAEVLLPFRLSGIGEASRNIQFFYLLASSRCTFGVRDLSADGKFRYFFAFFADETPKPQSAASMPFQNTTTANTSGGWIRCGEDLATSLLPPPYVAGSRPNNRAAKAGDYAYAKFLSLFPPPLSRRPHQCRCQAERSCSAHGATGRSSPGFSQLRSTQKPGIAFDLIRESPLANSTRTSPSRASEPMRKCFRVEDPVFLNSVFFIRGELRADVSSFAFGVRRSAFSVQWAPRFPVGTGEGQRRIISWGLARGVRDNLTKGDSVEFSRLNRLGR